MTFETALVKLIKRVGVLISCTGVILMFVGLMGLMGADIFAVFKWIFWLVVLLGVGGPVWLIITGYKDGVLADSVSARNPKFFKWVAMRMAVPAVVAILWWALSQRSSGFGSKEIIFGMLLAGSAAWLILSELPEDN
ncbi:hypothetical protein ACFL6Y_07365 [Elusimicrobiota bacterium]